MTREEELTYLFGILSEASKWTASADDDRDLVRMEVEERIHNLINGVVPVPDENGVVQSSVHPDDDTQVLTEDDYKALEAARLNEYLANRNKSKRKWAKNRVRVVIDGKPTWKLRSQCHKEVMPGWTTKLHWVWDGPSGDGEPVVDKLGDELWNEHEKGE